MVEMVGRESTEDQEDEAQGQEDLLGTETASEPHLVPQDILALHQALTMTTLLQSQDMDHRVEIVTVLLEELALSMELLVAQTLGTVLPQELAQGTQHLQEQGQGTLLLARHTLGYSLPGTGLGGGGVGGLGSKAGSREVMKRKCFAGNLPSKL
jgi:hypothetical protein